MSGIFGALSSFFGGSSVVSITLIGMLAFLLYRPERIVSLASFKISVFLLVAAIALPAFVVLLSDFKSFGTSNSEGVLLKLLLAATSICTAGSVYFLIDSLLGSNFQKR